MPIPVTCPGCLSRFTVSDKFSGKEGPCPKCKKKIRIPDKSEEIVIHAPDDAAPKDAKGRSIFKPIQHDDKPISKSVLYSSIGGSVLVVVIAIVLRILDVRLPGIVVFLGAIGLAPPLVYAGYFFLQDRELDGYVGQQLLIRVAIASGVFVLTWAIYVGLSYYFESDLLAETPQIQMLIFIGIMVGIGTFTSLAAFDLDAFKGFLHYMLYFVVTIGLCAVMGVGLGELMPGLPVAVPVEQPLGTGADEPANPGPPSEEASTLVPSQ